MKLKDIINLIDGKKERKKEKKNVNFIPIPLEKYLYQGKIKYMNMADMKLNGKTLLQIAKRYSVTGERIRQILKKYFSDIDFPNQKGNKGRKRIKKFIKKKCEQCRKRIKLLAYKQNLNKKFCNVKCWRKFRGYKTLPIPVNKMTRKQFNVYNNARTKRYYHAHKHEPQFQTRIKKNNKLGQLKYYERRKNSGDN